jgi:hypothetical protein
MPFKNPHPLYSTWRGIKSRCYNKNNPSYHRYGGRGITVCERWQHDFHIFVSDMGERPVGYTIERIDNNLGYSPENCKWATMKEQLLNRHNTVLLTIEGKVYKATELAEIVGMKTDSIIDRAKKGLSLNDILNPEKRVFKDGLALGGNANGARQRAKTHCKNGHEFTIDNTFVTKEGWRNCRKCHSNRENLRRNALK